ncbi:uncharacterized protein BYT42DRAFT_523422 [Radiomyces spectabilis]|uniref:uncharacterized protein n=1 Tax=Radiomyces spectabilis TaxID=64574 RepID=UPI00221ECBDC|nr:uncharacterized protein BYT42DRAFT_523422 [Radiomyces spectabilis]KAI8365177.1 hypothetical protein BYT42DRAFT_523422 [Radiomyces spectabilis]
MKWIFLAIHCCLLLLAFISAVSAGKVRTHRVNLKKCYDHVTLTQYWIPKQGDEDMLNGGKKVELSGAKTMPLKDRDGKVIAKVSKSTYEKFRMEGTGLLENGVMVNLDSGENTFLKVDRKKNPFGVGAGDNTGLVPWVSVASNDVRRGTKLYIKDLDGVELPNGKKHNGCVRVDDESWSFDRCQLDFFVLQYSAYRAMEKVVPNKVHAEPKDCELGDYVTSAVKKWAAVQKK